MAPSKECLIYYNHEENLTYEQIGQICGNSKHTVYSWFKKYGIKGKNNQVVVVPKHSKKADEKLRKYTPDSYDGISTIIDASSYQNVNSKITFECPCGTQFDRQLSYALNSTYGNVCKACRMKATSEKYSTKEYRKIFAKAHGRKVNGTRSKPEIEFEKVIRELYSGEVISSYKHEAIEFDIYIPELKLAFEYNGLAFHSEMLHYVFNTKSLSQTKWLHYYKTKKANEFGIRLIHIFEDDWNNNRDIITKKIQLLLGNPGERIFARKCEIRNVKNSDSKDFYNQTHIQGHVNASVSYGLFYDDSMVACMSFTKSGNNYTLVRYATSHTVPGGFSRLLKHFIRNNEYESIISFADLSHVHPVDNVYTKMGWTEDIILKPDYKYIENGQRVHKFLFRHKHLKTRLKKYDPEKSEYENCIENKIYRIWDCGKIRYRLAG